MMAGSRMVRELKRDHHIDVDLARMLADETYARELLAGLKDMRQPRIDELAAQFAKLSIDDGAWKAIPPQAAPANYALSPAGTVSAAAAWDPNYNPPAQASGAQTEPPAEREPALSPRINSPVKSGQNSSFLSRLGLSRPNFQITYQSSNIHKSADEGLASIPGASKPAVPIGPEDKKYLRGAR
jgi:hypothetical protein